MSSALQWHPGPGPWPAAAQAVLAQSSSLGLYGRPAWLQHLAGSVHFEPGEQAGLISLAGPQGRPQLVWPVLRRPQGGALRCLANYYSPLAGPVAAAELPAEGWASFFSALRRPGPWRACTLEIGPLPGNPAQPDSPAGQIYRAMQAAGYHVQPQEAFGNWHLPNPLPWAHYWAQRPSRLQHTVARKRRQFQAAGGRLEVISTRADAERGLQAFQRVYDESWKQREPHPQFIPGLVRLAADAGWLRLGIAWLRDEPVAAQLWLHADGKTDIHKLAYRQAHAKLGAGTLLTAHLMQHALEVDRAQEVDYLTGDDSYKAEWMSQRRVRWRLLGADPRSLRGAWAITRLGLGQQARAWVARLARLAPVRRP
jgi:hypothetical protein